MESIGCPPKSAAVAVDGFEIAGFHRTERGVVKRIVLRARGGDSSPRPCATIASRIDQQLCSRELARAGVIQDQTVIANVECRVRAEIELLDEERVSTGRADPASDPPQRAADPSRRSSSFAPISTTAPAPSFTPGKSKKRGSTRDVGRHARRHRSVVSRVDVWRRDLQPQIAVVVVIRAPGVVRAGRWIADELRISIDDARAGESTFDVRIRGGGGRELRRRWRDVRPYSAVDECQRAAGTVDAASLDIGGVREDV